MSKCQKCGRPEAQPIPFASGPVDGCWVRGDATCELAAQLAEARAALEKSVSDHDSTFQKMQRQAENLTGMNATLQNTRRELIEARAALEDEKRVKQARLQDAALRFERSEEGYEAKLLELTEALSQAQQRIAELERAGSELNRWMRDNTVLALDTTVDLLLRAVLPGPPVPAVAQREEPEGSWDNVDPGPWPDDSDSLAAKPIATNPSPQVAQASAEVAPVEGCGCESCVYCHDNHDERTGCWCRCSFGESAPTPSEGDPGGPDHMMRAVLLSGQGKTDDALTQVIAYLQDQEEAFTRRVAAVVAEILRLGGSRPYVSPEESFIALAEAAEEMAK